jgi:hypothetical protein
MLIVVKFENRGVLLYAKPLKLGNLALNPNLAQNPEKYTHGANNERMARERALNGVKRKTPELLYSNLQS